MIIAIDSLPGTGKTKIAQEFAKQLGFAFVSTGMIYRAVALNAAELGIFPEETDRIKDMLPYTKIALKKDQNQNLMIFLNSDDVTKYLYDPKVNVIVDRISAIPCVQQLVHNIETEFQKQNENCVFEGKEVALKVFPNADVKIFLTADLDKRIERRMDILKSSGKKITIQDVKASLIKEDMARQKDKNCPFAVCIDAKMLDTTHLSLTATLQDLNRVLEKTQLEKQANFEKKQSKCRFDDSILNIKIENFSKSAKSRNSTQQNKNQKAFQ